MRKVSPRAPQRGTDEIDESLSELTKTMFTKSEDADPKPAKGEVTAVHKGQC